MNYSSIEKNNRMATVINNNLSKGQYQMICPHCSSLFAFNKSDTYDHKSHDRDGVDISKYVNCPSCSQGTSAELAMSPQRKNTGFLGMLSKENVRQNILNDVNVTELRATKDDNDFKLLLIQQLGML